jgi:hypothetical protein
MRHAGLGGWTAEEELCPSDLEARLYDLERTHRGDRVQGRTPPQALLDLLAAQRVKSRR